MLFALWTSVVLFVLVLISLYGIARGFKTGKIEFYFKWTGLAKNIKDTSFWLIFLFHVLIIILSTFTIYWLFRNGRL